MTPPDLELKNISKMYRVRRAMEPAAGGLRRRLRNLGSQSDDFWAVRDVSFEVMDGEAVGIIGHNGAGKSTILKLLSGITSPTSGEITIRGRLSALIEVGSGFHPELTGRENVFLSGSILGMRRREIAAKLESIIEFAELRQFIDTPVKRYSSGMYVRLGFAIAAHLDPDILLLDEVLAVGDATFQSKCLTRIKELKRAGKAIVFISHDLQAIEQLCDRTLLMQHGRLISAGPTAHVVAEYRKATATFVQSGPPVKGGAATAPAASISNLAFLDRHGQSAFSFHTGEPLRIRVDYTVREALSNVVFGLLFYSQDGRFRSQITTQLRDTPIDLPAGPGAIEFDCPALVLIGGAYLVDVTLSHRGAAAGTMIDWQFHCATLIVETGKEVCGEFYIPHTWQLIPASGEVPPGPSYAASASAT